MRTPKESAPKVRGISQARNAETKLCRIQVRVCARQACVKCAWRAARVRGARRHIRLHREGRRDIRLHVPMLPRDIEQARRAKGKGVRVRVKACSRSRRAAAAPSPRRAASGVRCAAARRRCKACAAGKAAPRRGKQALCAYHSIRDDPPHVKPRSSSIVDRPPLTIFRPC